MTYKKTNNHDRWQRATQKLLKNSDLPLSIFKSEGIFRQFVTSGQIQMSDEQIISLGDLSSKQINQIWDFANAYFEMDMLGFDELNNHLDDL